jgi:hypothetical protein
VTWKNRPSLGKVETTFKGKGTGQTIEIDVKNFLENSNRAAYAITTAGTNELILYSRESWTGKPQLIIEYQ